MNINVRALTGARITFLLSAKGGACVRKSVSAVGVAEIGKLLIYSGLLEIRALF